MITRRPSLLASFLAGLIATMFATVGAGAPPPADKSPVGSWFVYICPGVTDPCTTNSTIINLASFTKDGITINADFGSNPTPSPGIGVWGKTGHDQIAGTFFELLFDAQGTLVGRVKLRSALNYDREADTLSGPFKADVTDPGGQNLLDHYEGTVILTRIQLEPLP
jgi:hypothetical protein